MERTRKIKKEKKAGRKGGGGKDKESRRVTRRDDTSGHIRGEFESRCLLAPNQKSDPLSSDYSLRPT